jgi:hypothetical protein
MSQICRKSNLREWRHLAQSGRSLADKNWSNKCKEARKNPYLSVVLSIRVRIPRSPRRGRELRSVHAISDERRNKFQQGALFATHLFDDRTHAIHHRLTALRTTERAAVRPRRPRPNLRRLATAGAGSGKGGADIGKIKWSLSRTVVGHSEFLERHCLASEGRLVDEEPGVRVPASVNRYLRAENQLSMSLRT